MCTGWAATYFSDAGGPEWLNEPIHPLQNRRRTQGSQSCEHDEGQHLPGRKETEFLVKWPRTKRSKPWGRADSLDPTPGAQVQTRALIPAQVPVRVWDHQLSQLRLVVLKKLGSEEASGRGQFSSWDACWARQALSVSEGPRGHLGGSKESTPQTAAMQPEPTVARWEGGLHLTDSFQKKPQFSCKTCPIFKCWHLI